MARILIFATTFVDSAARAALLDHWVAIAVGINPTCDLLLVDSASPHPLFGREDTGRQFVRIGISEDGPIPELASRRTIASFPDNIGHISKNGRDGWGRAWTFGLRAAIASGYDYVVHIEGDLLFRLDVAAIVGDMQRHDINVLSTLDPTHYWVEIGLIFFSTSYLARSELLQHFDWRRRRRLPEAEFVVGHLVRDELYLKYWRGLRNERGSINVDTIAQSQLVWLTHCDDHRVYDAFMRLTGLPQFAAPAAAPSS